MEATTAIAATTTIAATMTDSNDSNVVKKIVAQEELSLRDDQESCPAHRGLNLGKK